MEVLALRKRIEKEQESGESKSQRTGIFLTSIVSKLEDRRRIALFFTGRNHAGENMAELLARRAAVLQPPIQMCDGLDRNQPGQDYETVLANCLVHGRRKFVELLGSFPAECRHVIDRSSTSQRCCATMTKLGATPVDGCHGTTPRR